jgi:hypothetical protein
MAAFGFEFPPPYESYLLGLLFSLALSSSVTSSIVATVPA